MESKEEGQVKTGVSIRTLDELFSKFIRCRDTNSTFNGKIMDGEGYGKCITCGNIKGFIDLDCGHYIGRQFYATRWNPINCAAQCRYCNRFNEGMKGAFRVELVRRHGEEAIQNLEANFRGGRKPKPFETLLIRDRIKEEMKALTNKE